MRSIKSISEVYRVKHESVDIALSERSHIWWRALQCPSTLSPVWILRETEPMKSACASLMSSAWWQRRWSFGVLNWKLNFWCALSFERKWQVPHNCDAHIYPCFQQTGMHLTMDRLFDEISAFVQAGVLLFPNDATPRSWANFKCEVGYVNKQIHIYCMA